MTKSVMEKGGNIKKKKGQKGGVHVLRSQGWDNKGKKKKLGGDIWKGRQHVKKRRDRNVVIGLFVLAGITAPAGQLAGREQKGTLARDFVKEDEPQITRGTG